jgi:CDP-glucose 4,6-dehydratase
MPIAITRFGNLYGGGDLNWNRVVPGTIRSALRGEQPVIRSDGTLRRDYLYIPDAVRGYLSTAQHLPDVAGEAINFGLNDPVSVREIVELIIRLSPHPELEPIVLDQASNEIADQYLLSKKAQRLLGWRSSYSLRDGLLETIRWYADFLAG